MSTSTRFICGMLLCCLSSGCTAVRSVIHIQDAQTAYRSAAANRAPELAPFEHAMAKHYLRKAWEEAGHGEHRTSVELSKKSQEWTTLALEQVEKGKLDMDLSDLRDPKRPADPRSVPRTLPTSLEDDDDAEIEGL